MKFQREHLRYVIVLAIFAGAFLIHTYLNDSKKKLSDGCVGNSCTVSTKTSTLSDEKPAIFIPDIIFSKPGYYYRLIIRGSLNQGTSLVFSVSNSATAEKKEIGILETGQDDEFFKKEFIFSTDKKYNGLVLEKKNKTDGVDVFVKDLKITQLNITNDKEIADLRQSVLGFSPLSRVSIEQLESMIEFTQLKENNTVFGQAFKAETDNISSVVFDIEQIKTDNREGKKYKLELRKAIYDGDVFTLQKGLVASLDFNVNEIESYRQLNGKVKFPIYSVLEKGEYYFIGINNKNVDTDDQNFLILKGSVNNLYTDGASVAKKKDPLLYISNGDLYFKIYSAELEKYRDKQMLLGMLLEDLGVGRGSYVYKSLGYPEEIFDLLSFSKDVSFNEEKKILFGNASDVDSYFEYRFNMQYPFKKFRVRASQPDSNWGTVQLLYSYDRANWKELEYDDSDGLQSYSMKIESTFPQKTLYLKVRPAEQSVDYYGLRNLVVEADLIMR